MVIHPTAGIPAAGFAGTLTIATTANPNDPSCAFPFGDTFTLTLALSGSLFTDHNYQLAGAVPPSAATPAGLTFLNDRFDLTTQSGLVNVSASAVGTGAFYVDDILTLAVTHADGSTATYVADDSQGCTSTSVLTTPPTSLTNVFEPGVNHVVVTFKDACGGDYSYSFVFLTGPDLIVTPPLPPTSTNPPTPQPPVFTSSPAGIVYPDGIPNILGFRYLQTKPTGTRCHSLGRQKPSACHLVSAAVISQRRPFPRQSSSAR